jgi:RNA polymerase sigma factor (sigma-70 family)
MASGVAGDLRAIFDGGTVAGLSDGQLLERFATGKAGEAEPAFAALVARHGSMVLAACRGRLEDAHDAEDAFQATFLTLARKARSLRRPDLLGPWLHGVACRTARRLKERNARRRRHEAEASMSLATRWDDANRPDSSRAGRDEIEALHEEIERLPERYRTAIVLCDLQGLTHQEAGRRLGRPAGTISARVSRARERLRGRLIRRGLAVTVGVPAATAIRASGPPTALVDSTTRIAMAFSSAETAGSVPPAIAALCREVSRSMLITKLTMISATALAFGIASTGVAVLAQHFGQRPAASGPVIAGPSPPRASAPDDPLPAGARLRLGTSRFRPPSIVAEMALSPDEKTLVTVGDELIAWDTATGRERWRASARDFGYRAPAASYGVRAVAFAPDGSRFFTPGRTGEIVAWETSSGRRDVLTVPSLRLMRVDGGGEARSIDVAPDGRKLALGDATGIVVCNLDKKVLYSVPNGIARIFMGPRAIHNNDRLSFGGDYGLARFSPDGKRLAVVTSNRPEELRMLEAETGRELGRIPLSGRLVRFAFSPEGRRIATTERDGAVRLYDAETGARSWSRAIPLNDPFENYTSAIAYSPDGKLIAVAATDHLLRLVDALTGQEVAQLAGHHWYPWALTFAAKGEMLYSSGWDPAIRRWDVAARKQIPPPEGVHATSVVAASPDGRTLAYEDDSGAIRLVDAAGGAELRTLAPDGTWYSRLTFSADGRRLAGGGARGDRMHVVVWELPGGKPFHRWDWPKGRSPHSEVECLAFAPDGTRLAATVFRQSSAYLWDLTTGQQVARLAHNQVYDLSFSPDGGTMATAGWDKILRFWDSASGELRREVKVADQVRAGAEMLAGPRPGPAPAPGGGGPDRDEDLRMFAVRYAPDGGAIATAHLDGKVRIWQADDMVLRRVFAVPNWFREGTMSYSPDGLWLATGVAGGRVDLWDASTGQNVWDRGRHQADVYTVGFGRDARALVSGGQDGACYLWDMRPSGDLPTSDPARLWDDLAGDDGPAA